MHKYERQYILIHKVRSRSSTGIMLNIKLRNGYFLDLKVKPDLSHLALGVEVAVAEIYVSKYAAL